MTTINNLLSAFDEIVIAQRVAIKHDETRMQYHLPSNTVTDFEEFKDIITRYYNYHFTRCVTNGGRFAGGEARSAARTLLENEYRRRRGDIVSAFNDAKDGTNGGLRAMLFSLALGSCWFASSVFIFCVYKGGCREVRHRERWADCV